MTRKCGTEAKSPKEPGGRDVFVSFGVEMREERGYSVMRVWGVGCAGVWVVNECKPDFGGFLKVERLQKWVRKSIVITTHGELEGVPHDR